jgi:hypothetical protein
MKIIKLVSIAGISATTASSAHYLLSISEALTIKLLLYGSVLTLATMGVVLDDNFAAYLGKDNGSTVALISTMATFTFLGGAYRAFSLKENIEGYILSASITVFWVLLLALYIKIITAKKEEKPQW